MPIERIFCFSSVRVSPIVLRGTTRVSFSTPMIMPSTTARVRGSEIENVVPRPGVEAIEILPPSAVMALRTTSIPTPRPDRLDTLSLVEKPGRKRS